MATLNLQTVIFHYKMVELNFQVLVNVDSDVGKVARVFLSDFGIRSWRPCYNDETANYIKIPGSLPYVAPEVLRHGKDRLSTASDIWAFGCIGYELFTGHRLFESEASVDRFVHDGYVDQTQLAQLQRYPKILEILSYCIVPDPEKRWSIWFLLENLGQED